MKPNQYEIPPMSVNEKMFIAETCQSPELAELYEKLRAGILAYGQIEIRDTKDYINFRHPYEKWNRALRQKETKMGTLVNIHFTSAYINVAFNMRRTLPQDPHNLLKSTASMGVCNFYAKVRLGDNLDWLMELVRQAIYCVSGKHRAVRINNKFVMI